jgi:hypothetical protein
MITINEDFELEFPNELNEQISEFAVAIGDAIKDMPPLERFYALRLVLDELDGRISMYTVMNMMKDQGINSFTTKGETNSPE